MAAVRGNLTPLAPWGAPPPAFVGGLLVSCIMPTADRRRFTERAIRYFDRQDYRNRELVIVDDGQSPIGDLVGGHPRVHYIRLDQRMRVGTKRNLACLQARGEVIAHWDDDDWYGPQR